MRLINFRSLVIYIVVKIHYRFFRKKIEALNTFSSVLINISAGIGDALMSEPLIRAFKEYSPAIQIHVVASSSTRILFENHPYVQKVFVIRPRLSSILALCHQLRKNKYDLYIGTIPSNTLSQVLIPYLSGIPYRIKHQTPHTGSRNFDFLFHRLEPIPEGRHRMLCNMDLLKQVGVACKLPEIKPNVFLPNVTERKIIEILQKKGFDEKKLTIGFHPGCNPQAAYKRWAPENYARLMRVLYEKWNAQILVVGGKDEEEDVNKIETLITIKTLNFVGKADLLETAALIRHCRFFISNDSGIMHLATTVDVPVFAIFGPKDERHIGPFGSKHTVIRNGKDVNNVTVEQVVNTLLESDYGLKRIKTI